MKRIKALFLFFSAFAITIFGVLGVRAASTLAQAIDVTLEQQENTAGTKIRYISTITPLNDLSSITKIDINLSLSKVGEETRYASVTTTKVYDQVLGTNGKAKANNTYYSVYTFTDLDYFVGYTLGAAFKYTYADTTVESTNEVSFVIPEQIKVTAGSGSFEASSSIEECFTASSIEGGNIFHAWNWSMDTIKDNLDDIKAAGYTTVQTSPMQPQKDYYAGNAQSDWWKFYQPLGFCVAPDSCQNALGTKTDLIEMTTAAHNKGIKVIVDVVANHLAGDYNKLGTGVAAYEPTIYGSNGQLSGGALLHSVGANGTAASDSSHTTDGHIYLPDLDTGNSHVQQRVLSLLKEYIDCGVDGFRFDAAKHIETDNGSEPNGNSQFWPVVINGATAYAEEKGKEKPYYYGEILYGCGNGRSYSWYTKYMDVIDNTTGNNITGTFNGGNPASSSTYNTGCSASQVVVWAESHDTYSNESHESTFISQAVIDKSYAYSAARGKAQSLYFARPCADGQFGNIGTDGKLKITCQVLLGNKGNWDAFKSAQITAVNKFHNYWGDADEYIAANGSFSEIVRYNDNESGMVLINSGSSTSVSVSVPNHMKNGTYTDLVTGNTFTVSSGFVTGTMASCGIAVLYANGGSGTVSIDDNIEDVFYTETVTATYTITNAVSATLEVNGKSYDITSGATITFGSNIHEMETITVTITAKDSNNVETTKTFDYKRIPAPTIYTITLTKPEGWGDAIYAYMYSNAEENAPWPGILMNSDGDTYSVTYTSFDDYEYLIFSDGTFQSEDLEVENANASYYASTVTTSHFINSVGWGTVKAYIWNDTTNVNNGVWPGVTITKDGSGLYAVTYNSTYDHIIFNNGTVKTADLPFNAYVSKYDYNGTSATIFYNIVKNTCEHNYTNPTWTWEGYTNAKLSLTCTNCNKEITKDANITSEVTVPATTTSTGTKVYTATVTINGNSYTDTKSETLPMIDLSVTTVERVEATCETAGNILYYIKNGKYYTDFICSNEISLSDTIIPALGHNYALTITANSYVYGCTNCNDVSIEIEGIKIHYNGNTSTYTDIWFWPNALDGANYAISSTDSYGKYATIATENFGGLTKLWFIVKNDTWGKDYGADRYVDINYLVPDDEGYYHIYLQTGSGTIYLDASQQTIYTEA